jgi:hypothetical protein
MTSSRKAGAEALFLFARGLVLAAFLTSGASAAAQKPQVVLAQAVDRTIAAKTLEAKPVAPVALTHLVLAAADAQNFKLLGFHSTEEAKAATLGSPILVYYVPLDKLRMYSPNADPTSIFAGGEQLLYPVLLGQTVRSSVTLAKMNGQWMHVMSGRPIFSATIFAARENDAAKTKAAQTSYVQVSVPALNLEFLGRASGSTFLLIPLRDYPSLTLRTGQSYAANAVFVRLAGLARISNRGQFQ